MRDYIEAHPTNFKQALDSLRQSLNKEFAITLRIHSFFRHSRFGRDGWETLEESYISIQKAIMTSFRRYWTADLLVRIPL